MSSEKNRRKFVPIDVQLVIEAEEIRRLEDYPLVMLSTDYNGLGLIVTSSRKCDDGCVMPGVLWLPGMSKVDLRDIREIFEGFEEPYWPARHHGWIH